MWTAKTGLWIVRHIFRGIVAGKSLAKNLRKRCFHFLLAFRRTLPFERVCGRGSPVAPLWLPRACERGKGLARLRLGQRGGHPQPRARGRGHTQGARAVGVRCRRRAGSHGACLGRHIRRRYKGQEWVQERERRKKNRRGTWVHISGIWGGGRGHGGGRQGRRDK